MPRSHPAIAALREHQEKVRKLSSWLQGSDFADERGWLSGEERERFAREKAAWPWTWAALQAHIVRVRLDHADAWDAWIEGEIREARTLAKGGSELAKSQLRGFVELRNAPLPRWRVDRSEHPPRGDLYELEEKTTWRVTEIATGREVLVVQGTRSASYEGTWVDEGARGAIALRIEGDDAVVRKVDGSSERIPLA